MESTLTTSAITLRFILWSKTWSFRFETGPPGPWILRRVLAAPCNRLATRWQTARVEIRLLGPLEIRDNSGTTTRITSPRQRVVFAALALQPGQVVSAEGLVDCLWGEDPPPTARETVHSHVTRLRKNLPDTERARLVTRAPG